jgi:hypothetical protein
MGPLFVIGLILIGLTLGVLAAFAIARFFYSTRKAFYFAIVFNVGAFVGAVCTLKFLAFYLGVGATLHSRTQVLSYLASLILGGLLGGSFLLWLIFSRKRSNS